MDKGVVWLFGRQQFQQIEVRFAFFMVKGGRYLSDKTKGSVSVNINRVAQTENLAAKKGFPMLIYYNVLGL